jgi:dTDP-4-dehydrorhamnose 3,5-epimerase/CDP-3, 6-dideoxy-D-glycero-D-glycero-4-hexulose-5-epimerase
MKILTQLLPGCFLLQLHKLEDKRGCFVKTYHEDLCTTLGVNLDIREEFYSISHKNVLRGMHFQMPPHAHDKLVFCVRGEVRDVLLDLRSGAGYGRVATAHLSGENGLILFIPKGIAHGFVALTDESLMLYKTSTVHSPESDCGIRWDSFGFDWGVNQPCMSDRDWQHPPLTNFATPF